MRYFQKLFWTSCSCCWRDTAAFLPCIHLKLTKNAHWAILHYFLADENSPYFCNRLANAPFAFWLPFIEPHKNVFKSYRICSCKRWFARHFTKRWFARHFTKLNASLLPKGDTLFKCLAACLKIWKISLDDLSRKNYFSFSQLKISLLFALAS